MVDFGAAEATLELTARGFADVAAFAAGLDPTADGVAIALDDGALLLVDVEANGLSAADVAIRRGMRCAVNHAPQFPHSRLRDGWSRFCDRGWS